MKDDAGGFDLRESVRRRSYSTTTKSLPGTAEDTPGIPAKAPQAARRASGV